MFKGQEIPDESLTCRSLLLVSQSNKLKTVVYRIR